MDSYDIGFKEGRKSTFVIAAVLSVFCLAGGIIGGYFIGPRKGPGDIPPDSYTTDIQKYLEVKKILQNNWYYGTGDLASDDNLLFKALNGMGEPDPFTFYTPTEKDQGLETTGFGMGVTTYDYGGYRQIIEVYKDSGAFKAGLKVGDIILGVYKDNKFFDLEIMDEDDALGTLLPSGENEKVRLKILSGTETKDVSVTISKINLNTVSSTRTELPSGMVSYFINVNSFVGSPSSEIKEILDAETKKISEITFDLRDNGGGYVNELIKMVDFFVPKNQVIMSYEDKNGAHQTFKSTTDVRYDVDFFKILINERTASASEGFTLAMKELLPSKVSVYGKKSYGKGIAQTIKVFEDGSAFRFTFAKTLGPHGTCIHGIGIEPDEGLAINYNASLLRTRISHQYRLNILTNEVAGLLYQQFDLLGINGASLAERIGNFQLSVGLEKTNELNTLTINRLARKMSQLYEIEQDKLLALVEKKS